MKPTKLLLALAATVCTTGNAMADDNGVVVPDSTGFKFTDVVTVKTTPVRDQNQSGTCWSFSAGNVHRENVLRRKSLAIHTHVRAS